MVRNATLLCVCVCKHLVTRCRIFRGHLLGKTTCSMLQLVLISDCNFRHVPTCSILRFLLRNLQAGGQRGWGGSLANEDAPPIPCKRTCNFFSSENGKRLSQEPQQFTGTPPRRTTLQGMAMVGPCFK